MDLPFKKLFYLFTILEIIYGFLPFRKRFEILETNRTLSDMFSFFSVEVGS